MHAMRRADDLRNVGFQHGRARIFERSPGKMTQRASIPLDQSANQLDHLDSRARSNLPQRGGERESHSESAD